jgi:hypothetical protein
MQDASGFVLKNSQILLEDYTKKTGTTLDILLSSIKKIDTNTLSIDPKIINESEQPLIIYIYILHYGWNYRNKTRNDSCHSQWCIYSCDTYQGTKTLDVAQVKTIETDGYTAVVVRMTDGKKVTLREVTLDGAIANLAKGDEISLDLLEGITRSQCDWYYKR